MNDERTGPGQAGRARLEWPMAPGVPGSASAREARALVGLSADASDSEFVGASPSDGRDALVSASSEPPGTSGAATSAADCGRCSCP